MIIETWYSYFDLLMGLDTTHTQDTTNTSNWLSDRNGFWALWLAPIPTNERINFSWTRAKRTRYREIPQHEPSTTTTSTATKSRNTTKLERVIITSMCVCVRLNWCVMRVSVAHDPFESKRDGNRIAEMTKRAHVKFTKFTGWRRNDEKPELK